MRLFSLGPTSSVIAKSRRMRASVYFNEIAARNRGRRTVSSNLTPSAIPSASNILRWLSSPQKPPINTGLPEQTSGLRHNGRDLNCLSPAVFLQTSGLRGFSTELVSYWYCFICRGHNLRTFKRYLGAPESIGIQRER